MFYHRPGSPGCVCLRVRVRVCVSHLNEVFAPLNEGVTESEDAGLVQDPASRGMPEGDTSEDERGVREIG